MRAELQCPSGCVFKVAPLVPSNPLTLSLTQTLTPTLTLTLTLTPVSYTHLTLPTNDLV